MECNHSPPSSGVRRCTGVSLKERNLRVGGVGVLDWEASFLQLRLSDRKGTLSGEAGNGVAPNVPFPQNVG